MTKPHPNLMVIAAFAAVSLAGCSLATGATPVAPTPAMPTLITVTPPAPVPVTVTLPPPPAPKPVAHYTGTGAFRSPSGNIGCALFADGNQRTVQCEVTEHSWVAPPKAAECQLDWGSRLRLEQGREPVFSCSGSALPTSERTLDYGSTWTLGPLGCASAPTGVTCADSSTGHYFFLARETYRIG